jgi:hypothetical protein
MRRHWLFRMEVVVSGRDCAYRTPEEMNLQHRPYQIMLPHCRTICEAYHDPPLVRGCLPIAEKSGQGPEAVQG